MRLADFLLTHREPILIEWEAFARTCSPAAGPMDIAALRDHAGAMLTAFAADLDVPQSPRAQAEKSKGRADGEDPPADEPHGPQSPGRPDLGSAARAHGTGRAASGFSMQQMVAEYRALRASVLRLWTESEGTLEGTQHFEDLTRFNEAVDQALAESVERFETDVEHTKETFLAILGHDLRSPLGAIQTSAAFLLDKGAVAEPDRPIAAQIGISARRAISMVGELLDFTRSRLGGGIPVVREAAHLGPLLRGVAAEVTAAHPDTRIRVDLGGDPDDADAGDTLSGWWDTARLSQALGNLLDNAVRHGAGGPVTLTARRAGAEVAVAVHNAGTVIPPEQLDGIFNPMKVRSTPRGPAERGPTGSLGLGLYIAERIVFAHEGHLAVESFEGGGTTFTVHLPRGGPPTAGSMAGT